MKEDADGSIFRKNIGRALLNMTSDPYLKIWEIDMHRTENAIDYGHLVNEGLEAELEAKISQYLRNNITFVCFPVDEKTERMRLEEGIISTLNKHSSFGPNSNWLGLNSPIPEISRSGLWNRQGLNGQPLSDKELERVSPDSEMIVSKITRVIKCAYKEQFALEQLENLLIQDAKQPMM